MVAFWWILLIISVVAFTAVVAAVLPRLFLKTGYEHSSPRDRGVRNIKEPNGRSILYKPVPEMRKYVGQYILSSRRGKKILVCRISEGISYLDYDVALFDALGKVFNVLRVKELIENKGYTREVELPSETACVTVSVNRVNGKSLGSGIKRKFFVRRLFAYAGSAVLAAAAETFFIKICCAKLFGGIFAESFLVSPQSVFITCLIAAAAVVAEIASAICAWKLKNASVGRESNAKI